MPCLLAQEIRHLKAAKAARDQELADALKQLDAERAQVQELERSLLSQVRATRARQRAHCPSSLSRQAGLWSHPAAGRSSWT